jgi:hypothetical protein
MAKKRLHLDHHSRYEILQILSLSMFENPYKSNTHATLNGFRPGFRAQSARSPLTNVGALLTENKR